MKITKKINILIIVLFISKLQIAQTTFSKIIYKKKANIDLSDDRKNVKNPNATFLLKEAFSKMDKYNYVLQYNNEASIFEEEVPMNSQDESSMSTILANMLGGAKGVFYTNRKNQKTYHLDEFEDELYLIVQEKIADWILTQEKRNIGKYICYKATKKDRYIGSSGNYVAKDIIAWYTLEIPFPFGPLNYNGLPGLILELETPKVIFYTSLIALNKKKVIKIKKPNKGIEITQRKFDSIVMGLTRDFKKSIRN